MAEAKSYIVFKYARAMVAFIVVLGTVTFDFMLLYKGIPTQNKELLYTAVGGLNTLSAGIVAYYFGSSKDKSDAEQSQRAPNTTTQVTTIKEKPDGQEEEAK